MCLVVSILLYVSFVVYLFVYAGIPTYLYAGFSIRLFDICIRAYAVLTVDFLGDSPKPYTLNPKPL